MTTTVYSHKAELLRKEVQQVANRLDSLLIDGNQVVNIQALISIAKELRELSKSNGI